MIGTGIAEFPYAGGVGALTPYSVANPLPGLLTDASIPRVYVLRAEPVGPGGPSDYVDVATEGIFTDDIHIESGLPQPFSFGVELDGKPIYGGLVRTRSSNTEISNSDGGFDEIVDLDWLGTPSPIYLGPRGDRGEQDWAVFTRVLDGITEGVSFNADLLTLLVRDQTFTLNRRLEEEQYMGVGACLRFDGSGDWVDYGNILNKAAGGSFVVEILFRSSTAGVVRVLASKKLGGGTTAGWRINTTSSDALFCAVADGSSEVIAGPSISSYLDGKLHRFSMVVDRTDQKIYVFADGVLISTSASISSVGSLSNTQPIRVGSFGNDSFSCNGDQDDFRMWGRVLTSVEIDDYKHRELLGSEANLDIYSKFNEGSGSTASDSSGNGRNGTITGATWIGSLEGDSTIAGTPKPNCYGFRRQVLPTLVDSQHVVYQLHVRSSDAINEVKINGSPITFGSDVSDIYSSTPSAGTYNVSRTAIGTYIRFFSTPLNPSGNAGGVVTVDIRGDDSGTLGYQDTVAGITQKLLTERCGFDGVDDLVLSTFTLVESQQPATVGYYWDDDINRDDALNQVVKGANCYLTPNRVGAWEVGRIGSVATRIPTVTWVVDGDAIEVVEASKISTTPKQIRISYREYHATLTPDQVASSVSAETRDDFSQKVRWATARADNYNDLPKDAAEYSIDSSFDNHADAYNEAKRLLSWLGENPRSYTLRLQEGTLSYYIGAVINLVWNRYQLSSGVTCWVVFLDETGGTNKDSDSVDVVVVGPQP